MRVIKEYYEKDKQELMQALRKNKIMMIIYGIAGLILYFFGYVYSTTVSWKIGEFIMLGSIIIFVMLAGMMTEHVCLNILMTTKKER